MKNKKHRLGFILLLLVNIVLVYIAWNVNAITNYSTADETRPCAVGIVLGAEADDSDISEVFRQRLNHAIELYQDKLISTIIVTGGTSEGNLFSEAYMAKQYLMRQGIPEPAILTDEESHTTQENLENAKVLMDTVGADSALIISDPLHMKRAMLMAKDAGINAYTSPTQTSAYHSLKTKVPFLLREAFYYIGYRWYRVFGGLIPQNNPTG